MFDEHIEPNKTTLLSSERFTDVLFSYDNIEDKANRVKRVFPEARILIVLRNQLNIIASQYRDHPFNPRCVRIGRPVTIDRWIKIVLQDPLVKYANSLNYYETIKCYANLFGRERIGIFLFEELVSDFEVYAQKISTFLNIDSDTTATCLSGKHENLAVSQRYNLYRKMVRRGLPRVESFPCQTRYLQKSILDFL